MGSAPPAPAPVPCDSGPPRWRAPFLFLLLVSALVAFGLVHAHRTRQDEEREAVGRRCLRELFNHRFDAALESLDEYRRLAGEEVPEAVQDELFRLSGTPGHPLVTRRADARLLRRVLFFSLASRKAVGPAKTPHEGALRVLGYVMRNVQSVPPPPNPLPVLPLAVLTRGYGEPIESAWVMARLLRCRGLHAAVIRLPESETGNVRAIVGVLLQDADGGNRMYLFDPHRGVPVCRAGDGRIADLQTLLSGRDEIAPGFEGERPPLTVEALRKATYLVPSDLSCLLPDAWLLGDIFRRHGQAEAVYRSFRGDLRNVAAAVFLGQWQEIADRSTHMTVLGRDEVVALWDVPFRIDALLAGNAEYAAKVTEAHRAARTYQVPRLAQLHGLGPLAAARYQELLAVHADDPEITEDLRFFQARVAETNDERAAQLTAYLNAYPSGRWRPLATLLLAEAEARRGNTDRALRLAEELGPPYRLRGKLLAEALRAGKRGIVWSYPRPESPPSP